MKKKIIISALALTIGAGLAGSITGTAAWYQYSTKVNGAYVGVSGGATGNLNVRIRKGGTQGVNDDWSTFLSKETLMNYVQSQGYGTKIMPVTPGGMDKNDAIPVDASTNEYKFYSNPVPGRAAYADWNRALKSNYIVIPLQLRYVERDGVKENGIDEKNLAKEIYLSDLVLDQRTNDTHNDISKALRFHISTYDSSGTNPTKTNRLVSKVGGMTVTNGQLDLDGDGNPDTARGSAGDKYGFDEEVDVDTPISYGAGSQTCYTAEVLTGAATGRKYYDSTDTEANDASVYSLVAQSRDGDYANDLDDRYLKYDSANTKSIGSTIESEEKFLNVDITIWVEGWQKFKKYDNDSTDTSHSSVWNKNYIDAAFQVGFEFAINEIVED